MARMSDQIGRVLVLFLVFRIDWPNASCQGRYRSRLVNRFRRRRRHFRRSDRIESNQGKRRPLVPLGVSLLSRANGVEGVWSFVAAAAVAVVVVVFVVVVDFIGADRETTRKKKQSDRIREETVGKNFKDGAAVVSSLSVKLGKTR